MGAAHGHLCWLRHGRCWTKLPRLIFGVLLVVMGSRPARAQQSAAASALVFEGATVVDVEHGKLRRAQRVVIAGTHIQAVGSKREVPLPAGAQVVDARGKYLIPGLWDMHVHPMRTAPLVYPLFLANGVTGIRDAASMVPLDTLVRWRREILAGARVGPPRQILSGRSIDGPCTAPLAPHHICVTDSAAARHVVDSLKAAGGNMIKTYGLSREMYFVIAAEARRQHIPFGGHLGLTAIEAADSGASIIDHSNRLTPSLTAPCLDPDSASVERCQPIAQRFQRTGTWWVPTMVINDGIGANSFPALIRLLKLNRAFWPVTFGMDDSSFNDMIASMERTFRAQPSRKLLAIAHRVGLPMLAGSDIFLPILDVPGFALHAELEIFVAQGLSPVEALQSATLNPAKMLHATDSLGSVAAGKLADLVLLDANPLADITNTRAIRAVVANGRYFDRAALDRQVDEVRANMGQISQVQGE